MSKVDIFDPTNVLMFQVIWTIIVLLLIAKLGGFGNNFIRFGPAEKEEDQVNFMGIKIDSWNKVLCIMAFSFLNTLFLSWFNNILGDWERNTLWNAAIKDIPMTKEKVYTMERLSTLVSWINSIITFFLSLTGQLQFILPKFFGDYISSGFVSWNRVDSKNVVLP